jgi:molecular chaperone GrpE
MRQGYKLGEQVLRHALVGVVDTVAGDTGEAAGETEQADTGDNPDTSGEQGTESESAES